MEVEYLEFVVLLFSWEILKIQSSAAKFYDNTLQTLPSKR